MHRNSVLQQTLVSLIPGIYRALTTANEDNAPRNRIRRRRVRIEPGGIINLNDDDSDHDDPNNPPGGPDRRRVRVGVEPAVVIEPVPNIQYQQVINQPIARVNRPVVPVVGGAIPPAVGDAAAAHVAGRDIEINNARNRLDEQMARARERVDRERRRRELLEREILDMERLEMDRSMERFYRNRPYQDVWGQRKRPTLVQAQIKQEGSLKKKDETRKDSLKRLTLTVDTLEQMKTPIITPSQGFYSVRVQVEDVGGS